MSLDRDDLLRILKLVDLTEVDEIDCSEFLNRVAGFVERQGEMGKLPPGYEEVAHHLRVCPECTEEFEVLCRVLRESQGGD